MTNDSRSPMGCDAVAAIGILVFASLNVAGWVAHLPTPSVLVRVVWWIVYLGVGLRLLHLSGLAWLHWLVRRQALLVTLLATAVLSTLWSLAPIESLRQAVSLAATTLLGVYIGYVLAPVELARSLSIAFGSVVAFSLVALPVLPEAIVVEPTTRQWQGLMGHKNSFGALSAVALLFYLAAIARGAGSFWRRAMSGACLLALLLSGSVGARISAGVGVATIAWLVAAPPSWRRRGRARLVLLGVLGLSALAVAQSTDLITRALGRDATFNRRTPLWAASLDIIRERPLTGYGYGVVWRREEATLLPHIPPTAGRSATSSHNAVLNTATVLGVPAALVLVAWLIATLRDAARVLIVDRSWLFVFVMAALTATVTVNLAESYLLAIHSVFWIVVVAMAVMLRRTADAHDAGPDAPVTP